MSEFDITFYRTDHPGDETFGAVKLPATWNELQDAKEQARITNNHVDYKVEVSYIKRDCLADLIPENVKPLELNLLAQRLAIMSAQQGGIFDGMVAIEAQKRKGEPIPILELVNFTHSLDNCHVAYNVRSNTALGRWLYDNDMLSDDEYSRATFKESESQYADEYFAILGRKHCEMEGGAFTSVGYIEIETIDEVYKPGQSISLERSGEPVVIELCKGLYDDSDYVPSAIIYLPVSDAEFVSEINAAIDKVGAASVEECDIHCADCLIPQAKELIDNTNELEIINQYAKALDNLSGRASVIKLKSIMEAVRPTNLELATMLVSNIDQYNLNTTMGSSIDYAKEYLARIKPDAEIENHINLSALGNELIQRDNVVQTSYGYLTRNDGEPISQMVQENNPVMELG